MVAHDAANPLQGLQMTLALTREDLEGQPELVQRIDTALEATAALRSVLAGAGAVADLLADASRTRSLRSLADAASRQLARRFERRGVRFETEVPEPHYQPLPGPVANAAVWLLLAATLPGGAGLDARARLVRLRGSAEGVHIDLRGDAGVCRVLPQPLDDARALAESAGWRVGIGDEGGVTLHRPNA